MDGWMEGWIDRLTAWRIRQTEWTNKSINMRFKSTNTN